MKYEIPREIQNISEKLTQAGFENYLVGGCVRDLLLAQINADKNADQRGNNIFVKDWDIATNAKPEEIQKLFPDSFYENQFGTVGVKTLIPTSNTEHLTSDIVEITTFRKEGKYSDKRHPDEIKFAKTIEEDLSRRDFTVNAIALNIGTSDVPKIDVNKRTSDVQIIDLFAGQKDLKSKIIRTVGNPDERFNEDALRLLRAVRFALQLNFEIEEKTFAAIKKYAESLAFIAQERIRDELDKIIILPNAASGIRKLEETDLLRHIIPELREGINCGQNKHHIYTVFEHNIRALEYAANKNYSEHVRLASLLHDVGKPRVKCGDGPDSTFYNHEIVGGRMTKKILERLRYPSETIEKVSHLVRNHLFYYNVGEVSAAGVRRFLARVGVENVDDLLKVREADRIGSGVPKAFPYKLRHLLFMIEKVKHDPISPKMLAVKGDIVMALLKIKPSPKVGFILSILLEEVLDEPKKNTPKNLESRILDLGKLSDEELKKLSEKAKNRKEEFESGIEIEMKKKYYVK